MEEMIITEQNTVKYKLSPIDFFNLNIGDKVYDKRRETIGTVLSLDISNHFTTSYIWVRFTSSNLEEEKYRGFTTLSVSYDAHGFEHDGRYRGSTRQEVSLYTLIQLN